MSFSDDMAEAMERDELRRLMEGHPEWKGLPRGTAFTAKDELYVKGDRGYVYSVSKAREVYAPSLIDFSKPLKDQIIIGSLAFSPDLWRY